MSYIDKDDGLEKLSRGEHYHVSGEVTIKISISYDTSNEPGDDEGDIWNAVSDIVGPDFDLVDTDDLEYEVEND